FLNPARSVVIVPDGHLYRLPFGALQSHEDGRFWVEKTAILQSPSITYLFTGNTAPARGDGAVAFGSRTYDAITNAELNSLRQVQPAIQIKMGPEVTKEDFLNA